MALAATRTMANGFELDLDGFIRDMGATSDSIKREVGDLVQPAAERMLSTIEARYPIGRKHRDHVTIDGRTVSIPHMKEDGYIRTLPQQSPFLPVRKVVGPRLAYIWQNGTVERHAYSRKGASRGRGPAHARDFFERTAIDTRAAMMAQAQAILDRDRDIG